MEDLQSALQSILSDPAQMAQIRSMAAAMGLQPPDPGQAAEAASPGADPAPPLQADSGMLQLLGQLGQVRGAEERILSALQSGAAPGTRQRLDRAVRAARLSRLAGLLLRQAGAGHV